MLVTPKPELNLGHVQGLESTAVTCILGQQVCLLHVLHYGKTALHNRDTAYV